MHSTCEIDFKRSLEAGIHLESLSMSPLCLLQAKQMRRSPAAPAAVAHWRGARLAARRAVTAQRARPTRPASAGDARKRGGGSKP